MGIVVVTDSTSDIEPERARALGAYVVPLYVIFGDRSYRDYVDLSRAEFYRKLASDPALPVTSQPAAADFESAFAPLAKAGDEILCLTISSGLSGTVNAATAAAQRFPGARIEVYDSNSVAAGLGMMVCRACELAKNGASITEIRTELDRMRDGQRLYACLPDLTHVQRTGRIGKAKAVLGTLMKIVPVLGLRDGHVIAEAQVRTFARAQTAMLDLALNAAADPARTRFVVMHTNAPNLAETMLDRLRERLGEIVPPALEIWEAGPVIATHAGAGAVGIFVAPA